MTCNNTLGSFHCVRNALSPAATERRTTVSSTSIPEGMVTAGRPVINTLHSTKSPEDPTVPVVNVNGNGRKCANHQVCQCAMNQELATAWYTTAACSSLSAASRLDRNLL